MKTSLLKDFKIGLAAACVLALAHTAHASITADFDDGEGTASTDQYAGLAGDGWSTAWTPTPDASALVNDANPLNEGGNYLTVSSATGSARGVKRAYAHFEDIDLAKKHIIRFDWRFEGNFAQFDSDKDRPYIADGSQGGLGESGITTFHIRAHGDDRGTAKAMQWVLYNGQRDAAVTLNDDLWVNTGMSLQDDVVYSFTITVDPQNRSYDVNINNGTNDVTVTDMGFWTNRESVAGTLNFLIRKGSAKDDLSFSIDSISISAPAPDPS